MAVGFLNPNDTPHTTTTRPVPVRAGINERRWWSDGLNTEVRDHDLNDILASIRYVIDFYAIPDIEGDDSLLQQAIQAGAGALSGNTAALQDVMGSADKVPYWTSASVMSAFTASPYSRGLMAKTSLVQWQDALGLSAVSSPNVIALSDLVGGADTLPYFDDFGSMAQTSLTAAARTILDDVSISAMRTTLGLGTMALETAADYMPKAGGVFTGNIYGAGPAANWTVGIDTNDGSDSGSLSLVGGGTANPIRGAYLNLYGNEHATYPGLLSLSGTTVSIAGPITSNLKVGGPGTTITITQNTVDGTDTGAILMGAGGAVPDASRGAYLSLYGNEFPAVGGTASLVGPAGINLVTNGAAPVAVTGPVTISGSLVLSSSFLPTLNTQSNDYTFTTLDVGKRVRHNSASAHVYTINPEATTPFATAGDIGIMSVTGNVTLTRGAGVILRGADGVDANYLVGAGQYAQLYKVDNDTWKLPMGLSDQRLLGNVSGGPAVATGLTPAQVKSMLAITSADVTGLAAALALKADLGGAAFSGSVTFAAAPTVDGNALFHAGNDGAGSGLDADLLDAQNGVYYLARANHTGTQVPATILMAATSRFLGRITAAGGVAEELTAAQAKTILGIVPGDVTGLGYFATGTDAANLTGTLSSSRLADNTVPAAKVAFAATARVLGRITAGAGAGEELTGANIATIMGYTAADVFAKVLTLDGSGSGLDADLLDGQSSAYYRDASNLNAGILPAARMASQQTEIVNILASTVDGSDTDSLNFSGGGAVAVTRGSYLTVNGNESARLGAFSLVAGATSVDNQILGGAAAGTNIIIRNTTVDGADTGFVVIGGGGAAPDSTRGAYIIVYGNEAAGAAGVVQIAGTTIKLNSNAISYFATGTDAANLTGTLAVARLADLSVTWAKLESMNEARFMGRAVGAGAGSPLAMTGAQAKTILAIVPGDVTGLGYFATGTDAANLTGIVANARLSGSYTGFAGITMSGDLNMTGAGPSIVGPASAASTLKIGLSTADAADSGSLQLYGGGNNSDTSRGAYANLYGNEHATQGGNLLLVSGAAGVIKLNGNTVGAFATSTDLANATGTLAAARVANNSLPLATLVNASATSRFMARITAGAGAWEEATAAQVKTALAIASTDVSGLGTAAVKNTGTSGNTVALLDGANTWSALQTFSTASPGVTGIALLCTDATASTGPVFDMFRDSPSPAANDLTSYMTFRGRSSTGVARTYADSYIQILDPTNAAEDAAWVFRTLVAGAVAGVMTLAGGLYMSGASGGDKGIGSINGILYHQGTILGTAATATLGTSGATVPLLNGVNTWAAGQIIGAPTGGSKGVGSVNAQTFYINGMAVLGSSVVAKTATYTATLDDSIITFNTTSGAMTLNLPAAATAAGKVYLVVRIAGANVLTIDPNGAELIGGAATAAYGSVPKLIFCTGTEWFALA